MEFDIGKHCYYCGITTFTHIECISCSSDVKKYYFCRNHIFTHKHKIRPVGKTKPLEEFKKPKRKKHIRCSFEDCRKKLTLINIKCCYCELLFCIEHQLPEVHVCKYLT